MSSSTSGGGDDGRADTHTEAVELAAKLDLAGRALLQLLATLSRTNDLGTLDLLVLLRATAPNGVSISDARKGLGVGTSTMTGVVDRLETANLVRRQRSLEDRRRVTLHLTKKGRRVYDQMMGPLQTRLVERVDALDANEREVVDQLLEHVLAALQESTEDLEGVSRASRRRMVALRGSRAALAR
jgi:DNA-binding MarR family transcriptional regulator